MKKTSANANPGATREKAKLIKLSDNLAISYIFYPVGPARKGKQSYEVKMALYQAGRPIKKDDNKVLRIRAQYSSGKSRNKNSAQTSAAGSFVPGIMTPPISTMEKAISKLIYDKNVAAALGGKQSKVTWQKSSQLADIWLLMHEGICKKYWGPGERVCNRLLMVRIILCFGNFDLSRFLRNAAASDEEYSQAVSSAVDELAEKIRQLPGIGGRGRLHELIVRQSWGERIDFSKLQQPCPSSESATQTMKKYSNCLWKVIDAYLCTRDRSVINKVKSAYHARFARKNSIDKSIKRNLGQKVLSSRIYRMLYQQLVDKPSGRKEIPDIHKAFLMCAFMGLTFGEVCALDTTDIVQIPGYKGCYYVSVCKNVVKVKGTKETYVISNDLPDEKLRCVPIPSAVFRLLSVSVDGPLFWGSGRRRLTPEDLQKLFEKLCSSKKTLSVYGSTGKQVTDLSFTSRHLPISCAHLWRKYSLSEDEIRYLRGLAVQSTAAKYYIDFGNPHMLYGMYTQIDHAVNSTVADVHNDPFNISFYPLRKNRQNAVIDGIPGHTVTAHLCVSEPAKIDLKVEHGMTIDCRPEM